MDFVEGKILGKYDRSGKWPIETFLHDDTFSAIVYGGTSPLPGNGEDVARYGDIDTFRVYSGNGRHNDNHISAIEDVECHLSKFLLHYIVVLHFHLDGTVSVTFVFIVIVVASLEYLEHENCL